MAMQLIRIPESGDLTSDANGNVAGSSFEQGLFEIQKVVLHSTDWATNGSVWVNAENVSGENMCLKLGPSVGTNNVYPRAKITDTDGSAQNQWVKPVAFSRLYVVGSGLGNAKSGYAEIYVEEKM